MHIYMYMYVYTRTYTRITILVHSPGYGVGVDVQQHFEGANLYTYICRCTYTRVYMLVSLYLYPVKDTASALTCGNILRARTDTHIYVYVRIYAYICSYHYTCAQSRLYIRVYMLNADAIGVDVQQHLKGAHRAIGARVGVRQDIVHW